MIDRTGRSIPESASDGASRWFARRQAQQSAAIDREFERWLDDDPLNRIAYARLEAAWQQSDIVADSDLARNRSLPRAPFYMRPGGQVAAIAAVGALLLVIGVADLRHGVVQLFATTPAEAAFYQTGIGEVRSIALSNGVSLILDTQTRVHVRQDRVLLDGGRIRIVVPAGTSLMHVQVADADVTGSGATFDVDAASRPTTITSLRGTAAVRSGIGPAVQLEAGSAIALAPGALAQRSPLTDAQWIDGMVAFDATRLDNAIAALNRYNHVQIQLAGSNLGARRISGAFKATDPAGFAAALAALYDLHVDRSAADRIVLAPRP